MNSKPLSVWTHSTLTPLRAKVLTTLRRKSAEENGKEKAYVQSISLFFSVFTLHWGKNVEDFQARKKAQYIGIVKHLTDCSIIVEIVQDLKHFDDKILPEAFFDDVLGEW